MSQEQPTGDAAPYVQLFQKAHQRIVMLERLDEQVNQILSKRQELQDELRSIQSQLNEEFESRIATNGEQQQAPPQQQRPVVTINPEARHQQTQQRPVTAVRFAANQSIDVPERAVG